jgi:hypothetical protein
MRYSLAILLLTLSVTANAKCEEIAFELIGRVVGAADKGVGGVTISAEWDELSGTRSAEVVSTSGGAYTLIFNFNPLSGGTSTGDRCSRQLGEIRVVAAVRGYRPMRKTVIVKAHRAVVNFRLTPVSAE